jgi:hypothetical protein
MNTILHCWWQILVAAIPYFMLGAIWYNPKFLGSIWASGHGLDMSEEKKKEVNMGKLFGLSFICTLVLCAVVCYVCCRGDMIMNRSLTDCLGCGLAVGFAAAAAMSMNYIYLMKPQRVFLIDGGYHILGCMLAATVFHLLGCC